MTTTPYEYQPVSISVTEPCLLQVWAALESGLEAAEDCYDAAVREYGARKPLRLKWHADEVATIKEAMSQLRQVAPRLFPELSEVQP